MKRSQISLVLIIGIAVLIVSGLLLATKSAQPSAPVGSAENIRLHVSEVLSISLEQCLWKLGQKAGNAMLSAPLETRIGWIGYTYNSTNTFLKITDLERELASCVADQLLICLDGFQVFKDLGQDVSFDNPVAKATLSAFETSVRLDFPVTLAAAASRQTYGEFIATAPVRLRFLHNVTSAISADRPNYERPSDFDLTYLGNLEIKTTIYQYGDEQLYDFRDHHSRLRNERFVFLTANGFEE